MDDVRQDNSVDSASLPVGTVAQSYYQPVGGEAPSAASSQPPTSVAPGPTAPSPVTNVQPVASPSISNQNQADPSQVASRLQQMNNSSGGSKKKLFLIGGVIVLLVIVAIAAILLWPTDSSETTLPAANQTIDEGEEVGLVGEYLPAMSVASEYLIFAEQYPGTSTSISSEDGAYSGTLHTYYDAESDQTYIYAKTEGIYTTDPQFYMVWAADSNGKFVASRQGENVFSDSGVMNYFTLAVEGQDVSEVVISLDSELQGENPENIIMRTQVEI